MSRKLLHHFVRCLGLLLAAGFASTALEDSETRQVGNPDGAKPFVSACPEGQAVADYSYNSADQLMAIGARCSKIDDKGSASGLVSDPQSLKGAKGGSGRDPLSCGPGQAVTDLSVTMTKTSSILSFRATCRGPHTAPMLVRPTQIDGGSPDGSKMGAVCESGSYATAIVGTYKDGGPKPGIRSIGLRCHKIGEAAEGGAGKGDGNEQANDNNNGGDEGQADNDDADQGNNGEHGKGGDGGFQLDLKVGPDGIQIGGGGGGKKGSKRFAQEPTTIYARPAGKELAYLEQGETVTIVRCEDGGEGWCQISKPMKGFVWGGDLN